MLFTNKQIRSNHLNKVFAVSCWEMKQNNGRVLTIVEHAAFEDIIFNKMKVDGFSYDLEPIPGIADHPVFKCTMTDGTYRKIIAVGEAHPDTLFNKISRQNPVIMASNRAFDRAAIRFLDLEGKVYSSEEIPEECEIEENVGCDEESSNVTMAENFEDETDVCPLFSDEVDVNEDISENDDTPMVPFESADHDIHSEETIKQAAGSVMISFGKYRTKPATVAEICASDIGWAKYVTTMNVDKAGETTRKQIQAFKDFLK